MSKINVSGLVKSSKNTLKKYGPEILTGVGIVGMVATTISAVRATPKALMLIEEKKLDLDVDELEPLEVVRTVWPCYISPVALAVISILCLVGANSVNARRNAALATAYTISETALKDYRDKVIETIGEKKEKVVRDAIAKEKIEKDPVSKKEIIITNNGDSLCYEPLSGRYFKSDIEKIRKAVNVLNRQLLFDSYVSLNDFYDGIGLAGTKIGEDLGWRVEQSLLEVEFSSQLAEDGTPCLVMNFLTAPVYDYNKFI